MSKQISDLIKIIRHNGTVFNLNDYDSTLGITHTHSSVFIPSKNILVRGESTNPKSNERNAMLTLSDPITGEIKGFE